MTCLAISVAVLAEGLASTNLDTCVTALDNLARIGRHASVLLPEIKAVAVRMNDKWQVRDRANDLAAKLERAGTK